MKRGLLFLFICILALLAINSPYVSGYVEALKTDSIPVLKQKDELYEKIEGAAAEKNIAAEDARIDKIWKAIPGYNGYEIDIDASYKKMKKKGKYDPSKLIFRETRPKVHLKDLPPAPLYRGNSSKPMVAFAVNVAWGNEYLPDMLAVLKKQNVSASFFLEGNWVKKYPELARMIVDGGHEVGNHSYSHVDMAKVTKERAIEELKKTNEVIEATTGKQSKWFAPPSGSLGTNTAEIAASQKLGTIMWTVDTIDWQKPSPETILNRVTTKTANGSIILMHPTEPTAAALQRMILILKEKDFKLGTISELLSEERIHPVLVEKR
ncbi:polysaccharide deacetylase family protein [Bacillus sp. EB01]|uniref:polysaccharide deacetylase family protein n=1 Tax=Bacillus sp. EB01 TaxID=1347086 RepID=UPI0005C58146|nr:polysaccharide deacetylase family protein [Bacillus sp. EB01]